MMKKRMISLVMVLCILLTAATALSSCKKQSGISLSRKTVELDVSEYSIVYPDQVNGRDVTTTFKESVRVFSQKLSKADRKSRRGHHGNHHDQHLSKLLQKVKAPAPSALFGKRRLSRRRLCLHGQ